MCVGCRVREPQPQLIRVVMAGENLTVDPTFTAPGRGAYVHPNSDCVNVALTRKAFARALRVPMSLDNSAIVNHINQLPH